MPADEGTWRLEAATAAAMQELGRRLAAVLRAGDLVLLTGGLGAGKTTLTQGIGAGLGVAGDVTSPTFVIAREHTAEHGPGLVHVDAYRLGSIAEVDDLDLDVSLAGAVTVVEWGEGRAETLSTDRLLVHIDRPAGTTGEEVRVVRLTGVGERWVGIDLALDDGSEVGPTPAPVPAPEPTPSPAG